VLDCASEQFDSAGEQRRSHIRATAIFAIHGVEQNFTVLITFSKTTNALGFSSGSKPSKVLNMEGSSPDMCHNMNQLNLIAK
jgi:hypothetical protein